VAKTPFFGKILKTGLKFPDPAAAGGCFYINPSRRGPVPGRGVPRSDTSRRVTPGRPGPRGWVNGTAGI